MSATEIQTANKPIEQSQSRVQELQQSRDLAKTDAEILAINQRITAERDGQIEKLGFQLIGLDGVRLTTEERAAVEEKIRGLQREQTVALRDQEASGQALRQSTLDRLENEAEYAEKVAKTTQQLEAARAAQLAVAQARLRELDGLIAAEGRETQRNALLDQRYGLLGKIADLTQREATAPIEADERRLRLYQAEAETRLIANGLGDNEVANANLTLQIASQRLLLANQQLAVAGNQLAIEAAQTEQAQARLAFAQAYAAAQKANTPTPITPPSVSSDSRDFADERQQRGYQLRKDAQEMRARELEDARRSQSLQKEFKQQQQDDLKRELELQNKLQDVAEARTRGLSQIRGLADDAVGSAEQELRLTRERLALTESQLKGGGRDEAARAELLQRRFDLLLKEEDQQRKLAETRRAATRLTEELGLAEERLTRAQASGGAESSKVEKATRQITETRRALTVAERDYAQAKAAYDRVPTIAATEKLKSVTDGLVGAVTNHRDAVKSLAGEYRGLISEMDGVRDAGDKLKEVVYGGEGQAAPYNSNRERARLTAITQRRDAAQKELNEAIKGGDPAKIAAAIAELTKQQQRYDKQFDLLKKNGAKVSRTGDKENQRLANVIDELGIQYDREAVALDVRAKLVDREAENALMLKASAEQFDISTVALVKAIEGTLGELASSLARADGLARDERAQDDLRRKEDREQDDLRRKLDREQADDAKTKRDKEARDGKNSKDSSSPSAPPLSMFPFRFDFANIDKLAARFAPPESQPKSEPKSEPATNAGLRNLLKFLKEKAEAEEALNKQMSARLRAATIREGAEQRAQERQKTPATSPINNYAGDIYYMTVNALPGQSADAIAGIVIRKLENRARRSGKGCPS